jgi:cytochrome c oxidase assembly protein subunit 15
LIGQNRGLHRFAVLVAASTLALIFIGGLVTSTGSGLSVPDWPLSYGMLFPPMVGGILYEHGHRIAAATVGILTVALAIWLWKREPRKWVRRLGGLALIAVVTQGVLGGVTVLFLLPVAVSVGHAAVAEIFLCLTVSIALCTSRSWHRPVHRIGEPGRVRLRHLSLATTVLIYLQILVGALMRHTGSGLAIPDFPLSFGHLIPPFFTPRILVNFAHRAGALLAAVFILGSVGTVLRRHRSERALRYPALALLAALLMQIHLGAKTVSSRLAAIPTTAHVMVGAFCLAMSLILTMTAYHLQEPSRADEPARMPQAGTAAE